MRSRIVTALVVGVLGLAPLPAQESPYAGLEPREIKALSTQQIDAYLGGKGMSLALAAELNGYPGPRHVLDLANELELSQSQHDDVARIFEAMQSQAISIGERIVAGERALDALFADGSIDSARLKTVTSEIAILQGELRAVHLQTHLETKALLTHHQVQKYVQLRGYGISDPSGTEHHEHHEGDATPQKP